MERIGYSTRSRGARRLAEQASNATPGHAVDDTPVDTRRRANRARLIQKIYALDPLQCTRCGATLRIIAHIDNSEVIERRKRRARQD